LSLVIDGQTVRDTPWTPPAPPWRPWIGSSVLSPGLFAIRIPKSELAREAQELHAEWIKRAGHIAAVEQVETDAVEAIHVAHRAVLAEIERAASEGVVSTIGQALVATRDAAEAAAHPSLHRPHREAALDLATNAQECFGRFIEEHALSLLDELRPEAERVAAEYVKVKNAAEAQLGPLAAQSDRLRDAVRELLGRVEPFRDEDIPADPGLAPLPTAEAMERFHAHRNPQSAAV
jgi:hypothetical protein